MERSLSQWKGHQQFFTTISYIFKIVLPTVTVSPTWLVRHEFHRQAFEHLFIHYKTRKFKVKHNICKKGRYQYQ